MAEQGFLTDQFLIAMPDLDDTHFQQTVVYICQHDADGALGIVINRPLNVTIGDIFLQMSLDVKATDVALQPVFSGGPLESQRGFVIHQPAGDWDATLTVNDQIGMTSSRDIVEALAHGTGPARSLFAVGCAGWGAGQLEAEFADNAWLSVEADMRVLFETEPERRWQAGAQLIGVDINQLLGGAGHA